MTSMRSVPIPAGTVTITIGEGLTTAADVEDVAELFVTVDAAYGPEPWWTEVRAHGAPAAAALLTGEWYRVARAEIDGRLVGFAGLWGVDGDSVELARVMVHPDVAGNGIATACIDALIEIADAHGLVVWLYTLTTAPAVGMYLRLGFVPFADGVTSTGRPTLAMRRPIPRAFRASDHVGR